MKSSIQKLLRWYDKNGRDLPWRRTRDPYRILVSEIMLQQTQVSRGLVFYDRWLEQFPNWKTLAKATNAEVIKAWAGLGYNRRALMLRDIAKQVIEEGEPKTQAAWEKLRGIGPYTSRAIAVFSLHERVLPIDTNIRRVCARLLLGIPYPNLKNDEQIQKRVGVILPTGGRFYDVPQAIFDLATAVCTKMPDCMHCPMKSVCPSAKKFLSGRVKTPKAMILKPTERKHPGKPYPDRIYRGRILKAVREAPGTPALGLGPLVDESFKSSMDTKWVQAMVHRLEKERFIKITKGKLSLAE